MTGALLVGQQSVERDAAEANNHAEVGEQAQFLIEPWRAVPLFFGSGFIPWRGAANDGADPETRKLHSVLSRGRLGK
jgi:hypothetical protein